jgi:hypothetical protein
MESFVSGWKRQKEYVDTPIRLVRTAGLATAAAAGLVLPLIHPVAIPANATAEQPRKSLLFTGSPAI